MIKIMQIKDLKTAWKQLQVVNDLQPLETDEILLLLDKNESLSKLRTQRVFAQIIVFVVLTILCQGG